MDIFANAYLKLNVGGEELVVMADSDTAYSLFEVLQGVNENWDSYSDEEKSVILGFLAKWGDKFDSAEVDDTLTTGKWISSRQVVGNTAYDIELDFDEKRFSVGYGDKVSAMEPEYRDEFMNLYLENPEDPMFSLIDEELYYFGKGDGGNITYTISGVLIEINCDDYMYLKLVKTGENQITVVESDMSGNPAGIVLTRSAE
jgi:hypothetical protein